MSDVDDYNDFQRIPTLVFVQIRPDFGIGNKINGNKVSGSDDIESASTNPESLHFL